jgi:hypothetical protein
MHLQPIVRVLLTALAAGLGAAATQIDNETVQILAAIVVPTIAAVGIVPPQVPTRTVIDGEESRRSSWSIRKDDGHSLVELARRPRADRCSC